MRFDSTITPDEAMRELGVRLESVRLGRNLTRAELARRSGVPERTLARIECGDTGIRFKAFVAVCSSLSLMNGFESLIPERGITPEEIVKGLRPRKRARKHAVRTIEWGDQK